MNYILLTIILLNFEEGVPHFAPVYFNYNSFAVRKNEVEKIQKVAEFLLNNSEYKLLLEGHCDERGSQEYNLVLGNKRASSVKNYLVKNFKIEPDRIISNSCGKSCPVKKNSSTEEEHQMNRRVEFIFFKKIEEVE